MNVYLCEELNIVGDTACDDSLRLLCSGYCKIVGNQETGWKLWTGRRPGRYYGPSPVPLDEPRDLNMMEMMNAAISVQSYPLIRSLLPGYTDLGQSWYTTNVKLAPPGPLTSAVALEDNEMLTLFLEHIGHVKSLNPALRVDEVAARWAIELAGEKRSHEMVTAIFTSIQSHSLKGFKEFYHMALRAAIEVSDGTDLEVARLVLRHCPGGQKVTPDAFLRACKSRNVALVQLLLAEMDIHTGTILTLPLHQAIKTGDPAIIDCVLNAGADVNHRQYVKNKGTSGPAQGKMKPECPLEFATTQTFRAVELLLKRGAVVPPVERWRKTARQTYIALRNARMIQTGEEIPAWKEHYAELCAKIRAEHARFYADNEAGRRLPRSEYDLN